jgi:hypothetical protein
MLKVSFCTEILFVCMMTSVRISVLWLYYTLFAVSNRLHRFIVCAGVICIVWFFTCLFIAIFQCTPPSAYWMTLSMDPSCLQPAKALLGVELTNLFLDVAILWIPLLAISPLNMHKTKKIGVSIVFLVGIL